MASTIATGSIATGSTAATVTSVTVATGVFIAALSALTAQSAVIGDLKTIGFPQQYETFNFYLVDSEGVVVSSYYAVADWGKEEWADSGEGSLAEADVDFIIDVDTLLEADEASKKGPSALMFFAVANVDKIKIKPALAGWTIRKWAVWAALTGDLAGKVTRWS